MKKRGICILTALLTAVTLFAAVPLNATYGAEQQETEEETETETETEYPESYYLPIESNAIEGWPTGPLIEGEGAVVLDSDTGTFLYSKNMEAKEYPASITKIMTTLVAIEHGELDKKLRISDWALNSLAGTGSSMVGMTVGEKITLRQSLYAVMLASANECANAVAEKIGGSEEGFAELMNQKAAELGCVNTHFVNAHGLHDENHYTCARDMALIMKAAMENETFREIATAKEYIIPKTRTTVEERSFVNHHKMMLEGEFYYKGCLGGKPGFTDASLNTLVTVAQRKGRQLICVILRTNGPDKIRYETADLLDYGFKKFTNVKIPLRDGETKREDVLGIHYLGKASALEAEVLKEPMIFAKSEAEIALPVDAEVSTVERTMSGGTQISYKYNGWQVGAETLQFNKASVEIPKWELINTDLNAVKETETESQSFVEQTVTQVKTGWNTAWDWIYAHDIAAAVVVLVLILILLPLLVVAYIRNRTSQKIRKQRQKEREERVRIEKDIDSKSVLEIEAELRAELEKEKVKEEE